MKHYFVITDYGDFSLGVTQVSVEDDVASCGATAGGRTNEW